MMATRGVLLWSFLVVFLLIGRIKAYKDPTTNVNLSPFMQWRSAYECLQNIIPNCPAKFQLTESGLTIQKSETSSFCNSTCPNHARGVLTCLSSVKRDFIFRTRSTVSDVTNTINDGCSKGFTGITYVSSARTLRGSGIIITLVTTLAAWIFVTVTLNL